MNSDVFFYDVGAIQAFGDPSNELCTNDLDACMMHASDAELLVIPIISKCISKATVKLCYSGGGLKKVPDKFTDDWHPITRSIGGPDSANYADWEEIRDWITRTVANDDGGDLPMLLSGRERNFLRALYILGMGFHAATQGSDPRLLAHQREVKNPKWWSVPLLESARGKLESHVANEWASTVPSSVTNLVRWIEGHKVEKFEVSTDIPSAIVEVQKRLEVR